MKARGWLFGVLAGILLITGCERRRRSPDTELHWAAYTGDLQEVQTLITRGASVNAKDDEGRTPLHDASTGGHVEVARVLVRCGAHIDSPDKEGLTPAMLAMQNDRRAVAEYLVAEGAAVDLHLAAYLGDVAKAKGLIEGGVDVNAKDQDDWTPLHFAASHGHRAIVELLIAAGADVNARAKDRADMWDWDEVLGGTVLHCAVRGRHRDVVELLIAAGADLNARTGDKAGRNRFPCEAALHDAVQSGDGDLVGVLIDRGADIEARNGYGMTPLNWAARYGRLDMVKLLLVKGADANTRADDNYFCEGMPLGATIEDHVEIAEALIAGGADVNAKDDSGWTCLHVAVMGYYDAAVEAAMPVEWPGWEAPEPERDRYHLLCHKVRMGLVTHRVEFLIAYGADVNTRDKEGITPLHCAAYKGYDKVVELLIAKGADVNARTVKDPHPYSRMDTRDRGYTLYPGVTPLHEAAFSGDVNTVDLLIAHGSEMNARDEFGCTPLHYASGRRQLRAIERLIARGADVNVKNNSGVTPLVTALQDGDVEAANVLIAAGAAKVTMRDFPIEMRPYEVSLEDPLLHRALRGCARMDRPADDMDPNERQYYREWLELLLTNGADPDERDKKGNTPLHAASLGGDEWSARLLVAHGAHVNARNIWKSTALHYAAAGGSADIASFLLKNGADVNVSDNDGDTPLHSAALRGHGAVVEVLLAHGADTGVRNSRGRTPLDEAIRRRHRDIIRLLTPKATRNDANATSRSDAR